MIDIPINPLPDSDWINNATQIQSIVVNLWTVYVAIGAAAIALITSGREALKRLSIRLLVGVAYVGSAGVNLLAMLNLRAQHDILASHLTNKELQWHMLQPRPWEYIAIHILVDAGMFIAILILPVMQTRTD
jgi:hypothetical protein